MKRAGAAQGSKIYHYSGWVTLFLSSATAVTWLLVAICVAGARESIWSLPISVLFCIGAIALTRACLSRASIVVDDDGMAASFFGIRVRFIGWPDMKKIVKTRSPMGYGYYSNRFQVYAGAHGIFCRFLRNLCGNIAFDERIGGLRRLLDQINLQARRHAVPLLVWDLEAIGKQRPLIKPMGQRGSRTEVPVAGF